MLTRQSNLNSPEEYYADSLLTKPTLSHTVFNNLAANVVTPAAMLNTIDSVLSEKPQGNSLRDALEMIEFENETPGLPGSQVVANKIANYAGMFVNPIYWGFGEIASLGARGLGFAAEKVAPDAVSTLMRRPLNEALSVPLAKYLPEKIGKLGEEKTLSAGLVSQKSLDAFSIGAGLGVPDAIVANYEQDKNHINWGGVARDSGEMGALGLAIGSVPFAYGVLRGKVNRGLGKSPEEEFSITELDNALEKNIITPEEHKWYMDYLDHQKSPNDVKVMDELKTRASSIINKNGYRANTASNEAQFNILTPENISYINNAVGDELIAGFPSRRTPVSDFIIHNRLDELRQNSSELDGVRGYITHIKNKLQVKDEQLKKADAILDEHMLKGVNENMPFSQKELFKHMKQAGFESGHIRQLPVTIPENLGRHLKAIKDIEGLEHENKLLLRKNIKNRNPKFTNKIKENLQKIKVLTKNKNDYISRMNRTKEAKADVKQWEERILKLQSDNEILKQKDKLITSGKKYLNQISENDLKINKIKESIPKILTPKEELEHIRSKLLTEKGLYKNWETSNEYHRLVDLAHVWRNARTLLDRVHLERDYERQEAYKTLSEHVIKITDSNLPKIAKPENVISYLKDRIEGAVFKENLEDEKIETAESLKVPEDADNVLTEQENKVLKSKASELKTEFKQASDKFKEFRSSGNILKNLLSCVLGDLNA